MGAVNPTRISEQAEDASGAGDPIGEDPPVPLLTPPVDIEAPDPGPPSRD
jgi:hypothetical protein